MQVKRTLLSQIFKKENVDISESIRSFGIYPKKRSHRHPFPSFRIRGNPSLPNCIVRIQNDPIITETSVPDRETWDKLYRTLRYDYDEEGNYIGEENSHDVLGIFCQCKDGLFKPKKFVPQDRLSVYVKYTESPETIPGAQIKSVFVQNAEHEGGGCSQTHWGTDIEEGGAFVPLKGKIDPGKKSYMVLINSTSAGRWKDHLYILYNPSEEECSILKSGHHGSRGFFKESI